MLGDHQNVGLGAGHRNGRGKTGKGKQEGVWKAE
jgi:hypothetical protein